MSALDTFCLLGHFVMAIMTRFRLINVNPRLVCVTQDNVNDLEQLQLQRKNPFSKYALPRVAVVIF